MAEPAGLDLLAQQRWREVAAQLAGRRIAPPNDIGALVEADQQPLRRIILLCERPPARLTACPADMARALAVARLAADADLGPGRRETVVGGIVVLAHAGRVTLRAHEVPVLGQPGPVQ